MVRVAGKVSVVMARIVPYLTAVIQEPAEPAFICTYLSPLGRGLRKKITYFLPPCFAISPYQVALWSFMRTVPSTPLKHHVCHARGTLCENMIKKKIHNTTTSCEVEDIDAPRFRQKPAKKSPL